MYAFLSNVDGLLSLFLGSVVFPFVVPVYP